MASEFALVPTARLLAVASRDLGRACRFAERFGIELAYGAYQELIDSPRVDVAYIATPHPEHHAIAMAALGAGKAVLIEKAFTTSKAAALEIAVAARTSGLFAMEAMWTRFQPAVVAARQLIAAGAIGDVRSVHAQLGDVRDAQTLNAPESVALGRGALLDLGPYPVSFAQMLLGQPRMVKADGSVLPTGLDVSTPGWSWTSIAAARRSAARSCARWTHARGSRQRRLDRRFPVPPSRHDRAPPRRPAARDAPAASPRPGVHARARRGDRGDLGGPDRADSTAVMGILEEALRQLGVRLPGVW